MRKLCCLLVLVVTVAVNAQVQGPSLLDSLFKVLQKSNEDTSKVSLLHKIVRVEYGINPMDGIGYANMQLALAEKIKWKKGIAVAHNDLGLLVGDTGNNILARQHFSLSYNINKELDLKIEIVNNLNNLGRSWQRESSFLNATDNFFKALAIAEEIKNPEKISLVASNLTVLYYKQGDIKKAVSYAEMALTNAEEAHIPAFVASSYQQLGVYKLDMGDTTTALDYFAKALTIFQQLGNKARMANVYANMGDAALPNYPKAIESYEKADAIFIEVVGPTAVITITNKQSLGHAWYNLALTQTGVQKVQSLNKAANYIVEAKKHSLEVDNPELVANAELLLAELENERGNYNSAYKNLQDGYRLNDSLFSQDHKNEIAGIEGKHNLALKDKEIAIRELTLQNTRRQMIGLATGFFLLIIISILLYRQSVLRKQTNAKLLALNQELDKANKMKARFFGIISHDLRSPVADLVDFLQLQQEHPQALSTTEQEKHRAVIASSAAELLTSMEAMLLWSKEQMENFKPDIQSVPVADLYNYIGKYAGNYAGTILHFVGAGTLEIKTDSNYLKSIMQNLTANALNAVSNMPAASVQWIAEQHNDKVILLVKDNGPGIAPDKLENLLEDATVSSGSNGFGLHLVRDLAKAIHINVSVTSSPGEGTSFTLSAFDKA